MQGPLGHLPRQVGPPGRPHLFLRLQRNSFVRGLPRVNRGDRAVPISVASIKRSVAGGWPRTGSAPQWVPHGRAWRPPSEEGQPTGPSTPPALIWWLSASRERGECRVGTFQCWYPQISHPVFFPCSSLAQAAGGQSKGPCHQHPKPGKAVEGPIHHRPPGRGTTPPTHWRPGSVASF